MITWQNKLRSPSSPHSTSTRPCLQLPDLRVRIGHVGWRTAQAISAHTEMTLRVGTVGDAIDLLLVDIEIDGVSFRYHCQQVSCIPTGIEERDGRSQQSFSGAASIVDVQQEAVGTILAHAPVIKFPIIQIGLAEK